uniref:Uncharacterized protein n=1 Tax=Anguilla anguilla TaxID=7936 RepID=A0A0E9RP88_ANGAN
MSGMKEGILSKMIHRVVAVSPGIV